MRKIEKSLFLIFILSGIFTSCNQLQAQQKTDGNKSPVPKYKFSNELEKQKSELNLN